MSRAYISNTALEPTDVGLAAVVRTRPQDIGGLKDVSIDVVLVSGAGTFVVYGSVLPLDDRRLENLDPATNPFWIPRGLPAPIAPIVAPAPNTSSTIQDNAIRSMMVEFTATVATVGLTILVGGAGPS